MIALAAEWGTVPDWSMVAVTAIAVAVAVVAVVYGSRQSKSAAESKDIAAQARDEARRAADASERSAESARQVADIEARRDHRAVYDEVELVEVTEQARERFDITDRVARVRTKGQRTFRYRARCSTPRTATATFAWMCGSRARR